MNPVVWLVLTGCPGCARLGRYCVQRDENNWWLTRPARRR